MFVSLVWTAEFTAHDPSFNPIPSQMSLRRFVTFAAAAIALLLATGCERGDNLSISSEADEPAYRDGKQLVKQGRSQEALASFLKVIAKRGDSAPESHLEAGLLYLQEVKDPLAAIYHFRKYLELLPNSRQAPLVKQRIDVALREFAKTLPAQPMESRRERDELVEQIGQLQRENEELRGELAALRGGVATPTIRTRGPIDEAPVADNSSASQTAPRNDDGSRPFIVPPRPEPAQSSQGAAPASTEESPVTLAPEPSPVQADNSASVVQLARSRTNPPSQTMRTVPTKPTPPAGGGRVHTVVKGDTLFSIAQRYYGSRSRWRDIYSANRDQLPSENALRLGMQLRIP